MITYNFIYLVKLYFQALGMKTDDVSKLTLSAVKEATLDTLFRLKNIKDSFSVYCDYKYLVDHWKKIEKAKIHHKWSKAKFTSKRDISLYRARRKNLSFTTTIFSSIPETYALDDKGKITRVINSGKTKETNSSIVIVKGNNDIAYVHDKAYVSKLYDKRLADTTKALAAISLKHLDYKHNKYIFFITINEENIKKTEFYKKNLNITGNAEKQINDTIKEARKMYTHAMASLAMTQLITLNSLRMMRTTQIANTRRIATMNMFRKF